ncbi:hypothetical protein EDD17DRAFT_1598214, partial [Pisolithus thermaeus]
MFSRDSQRLFLKVNSWCCWLAWALIIERYLSGIGELPTVTVVLLTQAKTPSPLSVIVLKPTTSGISITYCISTSSRL